MNNENKNENLAPICIFVYNRLDHTRKTIEALQKNELARESDLYIFSDGPKNSKDEIKINLVRSFIKSISKFKNITIEEKEKNYGLADSIVNGVTEIVNKYGKIIVLEDDIIVSPFFLNFMNNALDVYKNENKVMHINSYVPKINFTEKEIFFYRQPLSWGWATWKRAWDNFNPDSKYLLKQIKNKKNGVRDFNLNNSFNNLSPLKANIRGEIKTWAIKWYASVFLCNGLCLMPHTSMVENIGFDGSGENCEADLTFDVKKFQEKIIVKKIKIEESSAGLSLLMDFFKKAKPSLFKIIINKIKLLIKKY